MTTTAIKPSGPIKLGLDFDNTIVCYDAAIEVLAEEMFDLPPEVPRTKLGLRNYLRAEGREPEWTVFQGELYGPGMRHAQPFEGAIETMLQLVAARLQAWTNHFLRMGPPSPGRPGRSCQTFRWQQ